MKRVLALFLALLAGCGSQVHSQQNAQMVVAVARESSTSTTSTPEAIVPIAVPIVTTTTTPPVNLAPLWNGLLAANPECNAKAHPALGMISIPKIEVQRLFVEGTGDANVEPLLCGPAWNVGPFVGQAGITYIAGHRTTHGAPFRRIGELVAGDEITITLADGTPVRYTVDSQSSEIFSEQRLLSIYTAHAASTAFGIMLSACDDGANNRIVVLAHKEA